jgi:hypothetical protein
MTHIQAHRCNPRLTAGACLGVLITAVAGVVLVLLATVLGAPGVTPDSVTYLSAADGLRAGDGYIDVDGRPLAQFPPLYPTLIAAATLGVMPSAAAARLIDALAFGVVIATTGFLIQRGTGPPIYAIVGATAIMVASPLVSVSSHLWSEPLFMAWVMLALAAAQRYLVWPTTRSLLVIALFAALATLTRYIGVSVVVTALVLALTLRKSGPRTQARHAALLAGLSLAPLVFWLLRNEAVASTLAGERYPSVVPIKDNVYALLDTFSGWFLPGGVPVAVRAAVVGVGAIAVVIRAAASSPAARGRGEVLKATPSDTPDRDASAEVTNRPPLSRCAGEGVLLPPLIFLVIYAGMLLIAATRVAADPIDDRLLSPLLAPAVVVLMIAARWAALWCRRVGMGKPAWIAMAVLAALWLLVSAGASWRLLQMHRTRDAGGYAAPAWRQSETIAYLVHSERLGVLYSNDPFAIRYWTGRESRLSPRRHAYRSPGSTVPDISALRDALDATPDLYLVWFSGSRRDFLLTPDDLSAWFTLQPLVSLEDGTVYRVTERLR